MWLCGLDRQGTQPGRMTFSACGFRSVPGTSSAAHRSCAAFRRPAGVAGALPRRDSRCRASSPRVCLAKWLTTFRTPFGFGEDVDGHRLCCRRSPRCRVGAGPAVHQQVVPHDGGEGLGKLRLPERGEAADVGQRRPHGQPVGGHTVAEADGAPQGGNHQHRLVSLAPLRRRHGPVAKGVVKDPGIDPVRRGRRFSVQPRVAFDVVTQRCAHAQQGEGVLVGTDRSQRLQYFGPAGFRPGKLRDDQSTAAPLTAGVLPSEGGSRISTVRSYRRRQQPPAPVDWRRMGQPGGRASRKWLEERPGSAGQGGG